MAAVTRTFASTAILLAVVFASGAVRAANTIDAGGLVCAGTRYSLTTISASAEGANEARLRRIAHVQALRRELLTPTPQPVLPSGAELPGFAAVQQQVVNSGGAPPARDKKAPPWPTAPDPDYLAIRADRISGDDYAEANAVRALAHRECAHRFLPEGGGGRLTDDCDNLVKAEIAADPLLAPELRHRISEAQSGNTKGQSKIAEDLSRLKPSLVDRGVLKPGTAGEADPLTLAYAFYKLPGAHWTWAPASTEIVRAAEAVPFVRPVVKRPEVVEPGSEVEHLVANARRCPNATFYVSPTRTLVRHTTEYFLEGSISVCVDTTGFATDRPLQVTVSTPTADRVYALWPGEPRTIPLEVARDVSAQVAHMTISGYPRREVLRAVASHPTGPLENLDSFDIVAKARSTADEIELKEMAAELDALREFRASLVKDEALAKSFDALGVLLAKSDAAGEPLRAAIKNARDLLLRFVDKDRGLAASKAARKVAADLVPEEKEKLKKPEELRAEAKKLQDYPDALKSASDETDAKMKAGKAEREKLAGAADKLCAVANELVPLVSEDMLVRSPCVKGDCDRLDAFVIQYDFAGGFSPVSRGRLNEGRPIFVQVRNVQPGWSVGAAVNNVQVVQRNTTLIGYSQAALPSDFKLKDSTSQLRPGLNAIRPLALEVQPPHTQILQLGSLVGGARYDLSVCATNAMSGDCLTASSSATEPKSDSSSAPGTSSAPSPAAAEQGKSAPLQRTLGVNTIHVHGVHHLGVRAGAGFSDVIGETRDLAQAPGTTGQTVRERGHVTDFGLPLLAAVYPCGRDATELPPLFSFGAVGGLDLLKIGDTPRLYAGGVADIYGVGLTAAFAFQRVSSVSNEVGMFIPSGAQAQYDKHWMSGFFAGITTDLDIFQRIFENVVKSDKYPSLPGTTK